MSGIKNIWQNLKDVYFDFTIHSSIHGVTFIGHRQRSVFELVFWILGFCGAIVFSGKLIYDAWNISPIIINFSEKPIPIWQIPFPTVTICPSLRAQSKHINLTDIAWKLYDQEITYGEFPENEKKILSVLSFVCSKLKPHDTSFDNNETCNECSKTLREIRIPPEEMFVECKFRNQVINCTTAFEEQLFHFNFCYTFNGLKYLKNLSDNDDHEKPSQTWTVDNGYQPNVPFDTYPRRASIANEKYGLSIVMRLHKRDFDITCDSDIGFWIELSLPNTIPRFGSKLEASVLGDSVEFTLKPTILTAAEELRRYPMAQRKCIFSDEFQLKFFKSYSHSNCEWDCVFYWTMIECGCLPLQLSEYRGNFNICGTSQFACHAFYYNYLAEQDFQECYCMPDCSSISYNSQVEVTKFNASGFDEEFGYNKFTFFFEDTQIIATQRTELYGMTDFLANCGGILSLCLGVSVVSFLEILYFCTIRIGCNIQRGTSANLPTFPTYFQELQYFRDKRRDFLYKIKNLLSDYSSQATIQGIKYVADAKLTLAEQMWWLSIVVISVFCCGALISNIYGRYDRTPLIINYSNEEMAVIKIPFPAITVCPQIVSYNVNKMYKDLKVHNISLYHLNQKDASYVTATAQLCNPALFGDIDPENRTNCDHCSESLKFMRGEWYYTFDSCHIHPTDTCETLFKPMVTEYGACYTFNGLEVFRDSTQHNTPVYWTLDDGYEFTFDNFVDTRPRTGTNLKMDVILKAYKSTADDICRGPINGFNVYLHLPIEVPQIAKHHYLVPFQQTLIIKLTPKMIVPTLEMRGFSLDRRQCYFDDERHLRFFRHYTQNNCEVECEANLTVSKCGCVRFHMPKIPGIKNCGISDIMCYQSAIRQSYEPKIDQVLTSDGCNCLPSCTTLSFDTETSQYTKGDYQSESSFYISELVVTFQENKFVPLKRTLLYGKTELLANCGGLLGVFLGFSLMSILELVYFCTFRLLCN